MTELDLGFQIPNGSFDAAAAGSITSSNFLRNSAWGANQFQNWIIHRPASATAADNIRYAGILTNTSGLLAHTGANYADTTVGTETVELWKPVGIRPDTDVLNALNRALEWISFLSWEPLSLAADAAMRESSATASWGTAVSATPTKVVTAGVLYPGFIRALSVAASANGGFATTTSIPVTAGEPIVVAALAYGVGQVSFFDFTNSATFDTAVTFSSASYQLVYKQITAPTGCQLIRVRLGSPDASTNTSVYAALWVLRPNSTTPMSITNPFGTNYVDERHKLDSLAYSRFGTTTPTANVYEGVSLELAEIPQQDYSFNVMNSAVSPSFIQFHNTEWLKNGCLPWIQLRLPYSEQGTFSTEASTTNAPLHLLLAAAKVELLRSPIIRGRIEKGEQIYSESLEAMKAAVRERATDGPAARNRPFSLAQYRN